MSVFKAREWWSTVAGFEEFHDIGCLCVGNIDNSQLNEDEIVVGSYHGILRVYSPRAGSFAASHLVIEVNLDDPILQVALGPFVSNSKAVHLLVLHPRRLAVHSLTVEKTDIGDQYRLTKVYEHKLQRTACNMVHGPFGGPKDTRECICVQSMDGQLSIYEQEVFGFARFLPNVLIPSPLCYVKKTNTMVTVSGEGVLEAYTYRALVGATSAPANQEPSTMTGKLPHTGRRLTSDWSTNLGENAIDIDVYSPMSWGSACIVVLGERSVFCCRDNGALQWMIKLDYTPSCLHIYHVSAAKEDGERNVKYMIATHSNTLMVYDNVTLEWAAQLTHPPVVVRTATFGGLKGLVVTLDELGHVSCTYMGTNPSHFTPPTPHPREMNFEKLNKEYKELHKVIRESIKGSEVTPVRTDSTLTINSEVVDKPRIIMLSDGDHVSSDEGNSPDAIQLCCEVNIQLSTDHLIHDVMMTVQANQPLAVHPCVFRWNEMAAGDVNPITLTLVCTPNLLPTCTSAVVTVMHSVSQSRPHITQHTIPLPLSLFCTSVMPAKSAEYKVTIDTNSPPVSLMTLFPEFATPGDNNVPQNAIGFQLLPGVEVTMVVSKTGDRYRLQSDCFEAIGLFEAELVKRLSEYYHDKSPPFKASFTEQLPLKEYFEIVEAHFKLRVEREQYLLAVEQHSQQFRAIQKRLLTRFKDKTPSSLQHLDTLLDGTFLQLIALSDKCQSIEEELSVLNNRLCCATNFIIELVRLSAGMSDEECDVLRACLCVSPDHLIEQGWEETTTAAVMHMLVTCLSKNNKEQQATVPGSLEMPADTGKLKRHLSLLFDRLLKGGCLNTTGEVTTWPSHDDKRGPVSLPPINDVTNDDVIQEED